MRRPSETSFDRYLSQRMKDPAFADEFKTERDAIAVIDALVQAIDDAREAQGITKAELARRAAMKPDAVRRLLTRQHVNPTLDTFVRLASVLDLRLSLDRRASRGRESERPERQATDRGVRRRNSAPKTRMRS